MWPVIAAAVRTYAPYIMFPIACTIGNPLTLMRTSKTITLRHSDLAGIIGYNIEGLVSDKYTPWRGSAIERREERQLEEMKNQSGNPDSSLKKPEFVPKNIFEKNASPQLKKVD